jgi:hypothetical protein
MAIFHNAGERISGRQNSSLGSPIISAVQNLTFKIQVRQPVSFRIFEIFVDRP